MRTGLFSLLPEDDEWTTILQKRISNEGIKRRETTSSVAYTA